MRLSAFLLATTLCATPLAAHEFTAGGLTIHHPYTTPTLPRAKAAAGYLTIRNDGPGDDRLTGIRTDIGQTMLHTTNFGDDGVARMRHLAEGIALPAGATVTLEPGGMHVMFVGLTAPLIEGARIPAILSFEQAGEVTVEFSVDAPAAADAAAGHDQHDHTAP